MAAVSGPIRESLKRAARLLAFVAVIPALVSFHLRARLVGRDRAIQGSTQAFALVPGIGGQYLRRAFLSAVLDDCAPTTTIEFGTVLSKAGARLGPRVYVGPRCHLGLAHIGADALLAAGVHVTSGAHTHGTDASSVPIRDQPGALSVVTIGAGAWIGSAAVVMANVGCNSIIGAGAVVTTPIPDGVVAVGVPARVVRSRA